MEKSNNDILCNEIINSFKKCNNDNKDNKDINKCEHIKIKIDELCNIDNLIQFIDM